MTLGPGLLVGTDQLLQCFRFKLINFKEIIIIINRYFKVFNDSIPDVIHPSVDIGDLALAP